MVINNIQVLRAAAALMVVFVHIDKLLTKLGVLPFGYGGVDIFGSSLFGVGSKGVTRGI